MSGENVEVILEKSFGRDLAIETIDKQIMLRFDATCLTHALPMPPERIRALRKRENMSQPVFARYLNVSKNLVSDWERDLKKPGRQA